MQTRIELAVENAKIDYLLANGWYSSSCNALPSGYKSIYRWLWWTTGYKEPVIGLDAAVLLQCHRDSQK